MQSDTDAIDGFGATAISVQAMHTGGIQVHDNIIVGAHRGIGAARLGGEGLASGAVTAINRSNIYNNKIQHQRRTRGSKAPYGIAVAGNSRNAYIYDNQIISDDGRGLIFDGNGHGVVNGVSGNSVLRNRIDVKYSNTVGTGAYVENNVYGIRDRYGSGDNIFADNTVMVSNDVGGLTLGFYVGSDAADAMMRNIVVRNNRIIARRGLAASTPYICGFDHIASIDFSDNEYIGAVVGTQNNVCPNTYDGVSNFVLDLTFLRNAALAPAPTIPVAPTGLTLTRFLTSYLLEWDANNQADVYEYVVYRDGARLPISPRGGFFYVDLGIGGTHTYSVSALTLSGSESARSAEASTNTARNGWW